MKGLAGSLVTLVSWLGSWIISYALNFLMDWSLASNAKPVLSLHRVVILGTNCKYDHFSFKFMSTVYQEHSSYSKAYVA